MTERPVPPVADAVDLRDFPFTPIFRSRLFGSSFHARVSDAEWRAGVTLWLKSWDQVPAGSLPDDDVDLCRLAELGRDVKAWRKLRAGALHGWFACADGRLYHKVVAEGVNEAWQRKQGQRDRTAKAREARLSKRLSQAEDASVTDTVTENAQAAPKAGDLADFSHAAAHKISGANGSLLNANGSHAGDGGDAAPDIQAISMSGRSVTDTVTGNVTEAVTGSKGQGQGQGQYREDTERLRLSDEPRVSAVAEAAASAPTFRPVGDVLWSEGLAYLTANGVPEKQARPLIGKWRREFGDGEVTAAIAEAQRSAASQPVEYVTAILQRRSQTKSRDAPKQSRYAI